MKIQLLSDVHMEFHGDRGKGFVKELDPEGIDVLVLAGDISAAGRIPEHLGRFCRRYSDAKILYIPGNHEYYGATREKVQKWIAYAAFENSNLVPMNMERVEIGGQGFIGGTLWYPYEYVGGWSTSNKYGMNDFHVIQGDFEGWVYQENADTIKFFEENMQEGDIVITHHLPSEKSVSPRFKGNPLNHYYVCPLDKLIKERKPSYWFHGHTHDSCDYILGQTRVLCNPLGYAGEALNPEFDDVIVEI